METTNLSNLKIKEASDFLRTGELVAFPTETVYGLGADATNDSAVAKIFEIKGRPQFNPLISHLPSAQHAFKLGVFSTIAKELASTFWPGPITFVVPRSNNCPISWLASAGLETVAIRVPDHPVARELLELANVPVAAPSANLSGKISPTRSEHVREEFGSNISSILEGGECRVGLESTVLDLSGSIPKLLRPGCITQRQLETVAGKIKMATQTDKISSPGMLASHYAPEAEVRIRATTSIEGEAFLGFGEISFEPYPNLSPRGDLLEAASNLFHMMRELDKKNPKCIAVAPIPNEGLGIAINDRLHRAAAPRR